MQKHLIFDARLLHPIARAKFDTLTAWLASAYTIGEIATLFKPFEGYRTPQRQALLADKSREDGSMVTGAGMWRSAHQFGLAVDYVALVELDGRTRWSWDDNHDWDGLARIARSLGLEVPISWDRPHVVHPAWYQVKKVLDRIT